MSETAKFDDLSELLGQLAFNTSEWAVASTASLRAVVATAAREPGQFDIALHLQGNQPGVTAALVGRKVVLRGGEGAVVGESRIDRTGHLVFRQVPAGRYELVAGAPSDVVEGTAAENTMVFSAGNLQRLVRAFSDSERPVDLVEAGRVEMWTCDGTAWPSSPLPVAPNDMRPRMGSWLCLCQAGHAALPEVDRSWAQVLGWANVACQVRTNSFREAVVQSTCVRTTVTEYKRESSKHRAEGE
jgi:hypothetical protein